MTMITPSYLGETIEYSSLHACRSTLEDPTEGSIPSASIRLAALAHGGPVKRQRKYTCAVARGSKASSESNALSERSESNGLITSASAFADSLFVCGLQGLTGARHHIEGALKCPHPRELIPFSSTSSAASTTVCTSVTHPTSKNASKYTTTGEALSGQRADDPSFWFIKSNTHPKETPSPENGSLSVGHMPRSWRSSMVTERS